MKIYIIIFLLLIIIYLYKLKKDKNDKKYKKVKNKENFDVKDDCILLIEIPIHFSSKNSSLNIVAGSDLKIEKFWPD